MIKNLVIVLFLSSCTAKTVTVNDNQNSATNRSDTNKAEIAKVENINETDLNKDDFYFVEINNIPEPFDVAGSRPYVLWINGERIKHIPTEHLKKLVEIVRSEVAPINTNNDIHAGWLTPHFVPYSRIQQAFPPVPARLVNKNE